MLFHRALSLKTAPSTQLRAQPFTNGWHSYEFMQQVMALPHEPQDPLDPDAARQRGIAHARALHLSRPIDRCARPRSPVEGSGQHRSLRAPFQSCRTAIGGFRLANLRPCAAPATEPPAAGAYDDLDPRISFYGTWSHDTQFAQPANHSVTYSDSVGASFQFRFQGKAVTWVYTRALNRGVAEVLLDGQRQAELDLYAADAAWQSRSVFQAAAAGAHVLEVRILNRPNPRSSGNYVDVDELIVE